MDKKTEIRVLLKDQPVLSSNVIYGGKIRNQWSQPSQKCLENNGYQLTIVFIN